MKYIFILIAIFAAAPIKGQVDISSKYFLRPQLILRPERLTKIDTITCKVYCPDEPIVNEYAFEVSYIRDVKKVVMYEKWPMYEYWHPIDVKWLEEVKGCYDLTNLLIK